MITVWFATGIFGGSSTPLPTPTDDDLPDIYAGPWRAHRTKRPLALATAIAPSATLKPGEIT